jgi:PKD repeat protein
MRLQVKVLLLSVLLGYSCLPEGCNDCSGQGDPDCRADIITTPPVPGSPPPAPLTLSCGTRTTITPSTLEWELIVAGGTPPFGYTLNFGDDTAAETGSWSSSSVRGSHDYTRAGDYHVAAQVRDASNQLQTCALTYSAPEPRLELGCSATPTTGIVPLTVNFDVTSRRGCIGPCEVTWFFGNGQTRTGGHATYTYEQPGPSSLQTYAAFAELKDSHDRTAQCRKPIQVLPDTGGPPPPPSGNHPPSIDSASASPGSILAGESTTISGTTSDPDPGDVVTWQLTFDTPGAGTLTPASGTGAILSTYAASPTIRGAVSIRVTASDSAGALAPYRNVAVTVFRLNQPPRIVSLSATPAVIFRGGPPSRIQATLNDPDGDPISWTLALDPSSTATGILAPAAGTGDIDTTFIGTLQGTAVIRATVSDGQGGTATSTVTVTVLIGS